MAEDPSGQDERTETRGRDGAGSCYLLDII